MKKIKINIFFLTIQFFALTIYKSVNELLGFIRFQFSVHGGHLYKRISLESNLNLII